MAIFTRRSPISAAVGGFGTWPGRFPQFRLHEPGAEPTSLPSVQQVESFAKRWRRRVPCPDPWAPLEGLYVLALHQRGGQRVYLGRYEFRRLVDHVLWSACERPGEALEAKHLALGLYALTLFKQEALKPIPVSSSILKRSTESL